MKKKRIEEEIRRIKQLKPRVPWVVSCEHDYDLLYDEDTLHFMKLFSKPAIERMRKERGVSKVKDLKQFEKMSNKEVVENLKVQGVSIEKLRNAIKDSIHCLPGSRPPLTTIDHRKAANPYLSLYGEDQWLDKIRNSTTLRKVVCITEIVQQIFKNTKKVFKGTKYENNFYFYHDALSLMTSVECRQYMKKKAF